MRDRVKTHFTRKDEFTYTVRLEFKKTNNEAEYEALFAGLQIAIKMGAQYVHAHVDSMLVEQQINDTYEAKKPSMILYLEQAKQLMKKFEVCKVIYINRSKNHPTDALSKLASVSFKHLAKDVCIEVLVEPSVNTREVHIVHLNVSWMTPLIDYLIHNKEPDDKAEARKIRTKALQCQVQDGVLYRRSFLGPSLRCVDPTEAIYLIKEIHGGICGLHAGPRMVVAKILNAGYYWPGMHLTAVEELKQCDAYQRIMEGALPITEISNRHPEIPNALLNLFVRLCARKRNNLSVFLRFECRTHKASCIIRNK